MARSVIEALPKTYHQPIRPAAPRGIGCVSMGRTLARKPSRASSQCPITRSSRLIVAPFASRVLGFGVLQRRVMRGLAFQPVDAHAPDAREQPARGRPGRALAVGVIRTPMAGAHEQARLREPLDRATEVRTVHGK